MTESVSFPMWMVLVVGSLALWVIVDRVAVPCVRWMWRYRVDRATWKVNARLQLKIPPFQRTKRRVLIDRLTYDSEVVAAVEAEADASGLPREVLMREVAGYAREIVPSFNAYIYFRIGYPIARRILQFLYRVRLGYADDAALAGIEPDDSVVFVMNHRSDLDYIIVAYMAANRAALSYAVGQWARVWPLRSLIKSPGGFFVRRRSDITPSTGGCWRGMYGWLPMAAWSWAFARRAGLRVTAASSSHDSGFLATWSRHSIPWASATSFSSLWVSITTGFWKTGP